MTEKNDESDSLSEGSDSNDAINKGDSDSQNDSFNCGSDVSCADAEIYEESGSSSASVSPKRKIEHTNWQNKKTKYEDAHMRTIMAELMEECDSHDDLSAQILKYLEEFRWKNGLSESTIKKLEPIYSKICKDISTMPKIDHILTLSMPHEEKCDAIEKILILYNAQPNTFEFLQLKRHLNKTIEKYKLFSMSEPDYEKYKKIEEALTFSEKKIKPLKYRILDANMSNSNKAYIYQRYKYFSTLDSTNSEFNKLKQWLDVALDLPDEIKPIGAAHDLNREANKYLWSIKNKLDREIFGLEVVKEKILFLLNNRITNNNSKGLSFALCGPPGTAKTSIINALSKAIDLPFFQINLGGAKDVSFLSGHGYTYEGATPGVIVQALTTLKYKNGIIYFDEFDKISNSLHGTEISRMLLHITDFTQNDKFHDRYLSNGIDIDLSNIWFIYSLNDKEMLDKTLSDRIPIIEVDGYNDNEKYQITRYFIIPKALDNINLGRDQVIFSDCAIKYIIELSEINQPTEGKSGVRQIKHIVDSILMKINLLKTVYSNGDNDIYDLNLSFDIVGFKLPILITKEIIRCIKINTYADKNVSYRHMYM